LVIGNGQLLVGFDDRLVLRDLYYPRVGQVNQITGRHNQYGLWVDGQFAWLSDDGWERTQGYQPDSLVGRSTAAHALLGLRLEIADAVHPHRNLLLRQVRVHNGLEQPREVRLFLSTDFNIDESDVGDTAMWDESAGVMLHYKRNRWFLMGAAGPYTGITQYATGRKRFAGAEGTWRDAEDGQLEGHPITQGAVDSTIGLEAILPTGGDLLFNFWLTCGANWSECREQDRFVRYEGVGELVAQTDRYWRGWLQTGAEASEGLPEDLQQAYNRSLLVIRTQMDHGGAILAANDSDILQYNRDHYSYMWPRDGAFIAAALDRAGYTGLTSRFYGFCERAITPEGYFWHKYNPDGTVGSSWHPLVGPKGAQLPIQEDETGLVLWAVGEHLRRTQDREVLLALYPTLIQPAADFLLRYRQEGTGLPLESYDLWEERRGIFTFTTATVIAGLRAAAWAAEELGSGAAERYRAAAGEMLTALMRDLWSEEQGRFRRGIYLRGDGEIVLDETLESSILGIFLLGVLPAAEPKLAQTVDQLAEGLWAKTEIGGIARYFNDYYFRVADDPTVIPGNPWIICTLWLARYQIASARRTSDLDRPLELIRWALARALPSGVLPEQINPFTGEALSVLPLTWSHATLVDALIDLAAKLRSLPPGE
jgi:GH15 family glucan-1,4-alpha-glucosidase